MNSTNDSTGDSAMVIQRSIVVTAQRERVWRAITDPAQFSRWFGYPMKFERLVVGETIFFGEDETDTGLIAHVEPMDRYAFKWQAEPGYRTLVTFRLESVPEGTRITVTEEGFEALPETLRRSRFMSNDEGWRIQLENIATYVQTAINA